ncbi:MAG: glutaminyl-peptide cyclotransferase [Roseiflexaceae bacterium]
MFDQLRTRRGAALVLLMLLSACGGAQEPIAPSQVPAAPVPTAVTSLPLSTAEPPPSLVPPTISLATAAPSPPTAIPSPSLAPPPTAAPAPPTAIPSPSPPPPAPTASEAQLSTICIPDRTPLPGLPTVSEAAPGTDPSRTAPAAPPVSSFEVIQTYPHDPRAWTEGLVFVDGVLYEGTGRENGPATLSKLDLATGAVLQRCALPLDFYGEGVTVFGDAIYQLTWQSHVGFAYDKASFAFRRAWSYPTEGWGLTHDETRLIMSDGTSTLHFLDPATLAETGRIDAYDENGPVIRLNELEYIQGQIYANVWLTDRIARIDPQSGQVLGWIDLSGLLGPRDRGQPVAELNGIAYDAGGDRLFVTGKLWPKLFEIKLK